MLKQYKNWFDKTPIFRLHGYFKLQPHIAITDHDADRIRTLHLYDDPLAEGKFIQATGILYNEIPNDLQDACYSIMKSSATAASTERRQRLRVKAGILLYFGKMLALLLL